MNETANLYPGKKPVRVRGYAILLTMAWTAAVTVSLVSGLYLENQEVIQIAEIQTQMAFQRDLSFQAWHGENAEVYVPVTEATRPIPISAGAPDRDLVTQDGIQLSLGGPTSTLRQANETDEQIFGVLTRFTSLDPIGSDNTPDPWEVAALGAFETGIQEISSVEVLDGKSYARMMRPVFLEQSCLGCHGHEGYKVGDLRGGLSVSVPLALYAHASRRHAVALVVGHGSLWAIGLGALLVGILNLRRRVRERSAAEYRTRAALRRYDLILAGASEGIIGLDSSERITFANPAATRTLQWDDQEFVGRVLDEITVESKESIPIADPSDTSPERSEMTFVRNDGSQIPVELNRTAFGLKEDPLEGSVITFRDISEQKAIGEKLALQSAALNAAANAVIITDRGGRITWANPAFSTLTGYSFEEIQGKNPRFLNSRTQEPAFYQNMWDNINAGRVWQGELVNRKKSGELYHEQMTITPVRSEQGEISHFVAIKLDITERMQAEEMTTRLGRVLDGSLHEIYFFDATSLNFLQVNQGALSNLGYTHEEILNLSPLDIEPDTSETSFNERLHPLLTGKCEKVEFVSVHKRKDGTCYPAEVHLQLSAIGSSPVIVAFVLDITERQQAEKERRAYEEKIQHTQRLESLGVFAGGIAHDFNNLLMVILGYTNLAMEDDESSDEINSYLQQIEGAGRRAKELVKQILAFSRVENQELQPVEFGLIVKESLKLIRGVLPSNIEIRQDIDAHCGMALADPTQLHQIVMNLCTNAYQAMKESGGTLEISLRLETPDLESANGDPESESRRRVTLRVSDTGEGMDAETLSRIFEPFYTTRGVGEGTGLGLPTVHGIVTGYGGTVEVESTIGQGSVFTVRLPQAFDHPDQVAEQGADIPHGKERVLYVDDEASIAQLGQFGLQNLGYTVTSFTSSTDALAAFSEKPDAFDVVVSDVTMPRMDGLELATELLRIRSELPIILCTGYNGNGLSEKALELGVREIADKPIDFTSLATKIRRALSEKPLTLVDVEETRNAEAKGY